MKNYNSKYRKNTFLLEIKILQKKTFVLSLLLMFFHYFGYTQHIKKSDTTSVYHNIYDYSKSKKSSKFIYRLFFRQSELKQPVISELVKNTTNSSPISENKIVKNIYIITLDPFGYSTIDTLRKPKKEFEKLGNTLHIKSKKNAIKKFLLFKKNSIINNSIIEETERLLRNQRYIRKVKITTKNIDENLVDVYIRVLDSWSFIATGSFSSSKWNTRLVERNFFGFGHQITASHSELFDTKQNAKSISYTIPNIKNTFINLTARYNDDYDGNNRRRIGINRNFFSPITKNAGGLYFENNVTNIGFSVNNETLTSLAKNEYQEYWYGRAFPLYKHNNIERTNLIVASLFSKRNYIKEPDKTLDNNNYFTSENNFISYIGIVTQRYYQDKYLFNFGILEDVPYGNNFTLTFGKQTKNNENRFYFGASISSGKRTKIGYISGYTKWGSFFNNGKTEQTTFSIGGQYISPIFNIGTWRFRHFITPFTSYGFNRLNSQYDLLTLSGENGISNFSNNYFGTKKWVINMQIQSYTPKNWYGFHINPYLNYTIGSLANSTSFLKSKVYSKLSIGLHISNDYLVFNSFQVSFSYYPSIPFEGTHILQTNSYDNTDFRLSEFQSGKPQYILYN